MATFFFHIFLHEAHELWLFDVKKFMFGMSTLLIFKIINSKVSTFFLVYIYFLAHIFCLAYVPFQSLKLSIQRHFSSGGKPSQVSIYHLLRFCIKPTIVFVSNKFSVTIVAN